jgi:2-hydroxychromene-2-carboxylate isomerase
VSEELDYFYSFRSPYSYLSGPRAFALPDRFEVKLRFRGVIPMAMRGQAVSRAKRLHTIRDVAREAHRLGMPFGRIHDPIGEGAERCLLVAAYAVDQERAREFVLSGGQGIWGEAISVESERGLRQVSERAGLDWKQCERALRDPAYHKRVEQDTQALAEAGLWGVPVLVFRGEPFWGQDRIGAVETALRDAGLQRVAGAAVALGR